MAQWIRHWSALPNICHSWHLQGATIPIGANVRVGLISPPSEIKTLFAFHFLCVSLVSLSCISLGACHNLTERDLVTHLPLMPCPAGSVFFIKVH